MARIDAGTRETKLLVLPSERDVAEISLLVSKLVADIDDDRKVCWHSNPSFVGAYGAGFACQSVGASFVAPDVRRVLPLPSRFMTHTSLPAPLAMRAKAS